MALKARVSLGDVVAMPAGVRWLYNDGDVPLVVNNVNQLEPSMRKFLLAGGYSKGKLHFAKNIFRGIDAHLLSEAMDPSGSSAGTTTAARSSAWSTASTSTVNHHHHHQSYYAGAGGWDFDGSSSSLCGGAWRLWARGQAGDDEYSYYNPGAGRVTRLTRRRFPILDVVQMSAARVDVYPDAVVEPERAQRAVASGLGSCSSCRKDTSSEPVVSHFAGARSVLRDLPVDVVAGSYGVSREEAMALKNNRRHEHGVSRMKIALDASAAVEAEEHGAAVVGVDEVDCGGVDGRL
ncbi:hypothetical protein U9M48_041455 [Paspalum notatum var. saurae]|uniref:Cupin type-1 domain-containing protein n=1 Tax=Paspalum notatum var. saurae TaxID=547442 RepID=A0AAQ3XFA0_PASNO